MSKVDRNLLIGKGLEPMGSGGSALISFTERLKGDGGITQADGLTARATSAIGQRELTAIGSQQRFRASLNKLLTKLGDVYVAKIRRLVAGHGAYITGRFYSGFKAIRWDDHGAGFNTAVAIVNPVFYAPWVHPKGYPKTKTILKEIRRDLLPQMRKDLRVDLALLLRQKAIATIMARK